MSKKQLLRRLEALERRVAWLEASAGTPPPPFYVVPRWPGDGTEIPPPPESFRVTCGDTASVYEPSSTGSSRPAGSTRP